MTATVPAPVTLDPVTVEIIRHKLDQVVVEAMDALRNVSGSPTTNEGNDLMVALYRADGGLMVGGVGFLHHLTSASQAVKHILATFGDDPGIHEGDVFMLNDSYTAALHPPDIYITSPIFWEGRLWGFVANFVHATDIGAVDPGGFSPNARSCYQEGFVTKGLKIIEGGRARRDVIDTYLNQVREPGLVALDLKSQLAANHAAGDRLHELFEEYGPDTVDAVSAEMIGRSERGFRDRLAELPDGTWRCVQYVDWPDRLHRIELAMTKRGSTLEFDYTGTGPQSILGVNNSYWATLGGTFAPIYPLLAWDLTWNEGLMTSVRVIAPEGTLVNCVKPAPISVATVAMIKVINDIVSLLIGRMLASSDQYRDRAMAVWDGVHSAISMVGADAAGIPFIAYSTDAFAGAGGAHADRDGIDIGGEIANGMSRWANAETHELGAPLVFLFRRPVPDSGGPGKYRGGVTHEFAFAPHGISTEGMTLIAMTKGLTTALSRGLSGGLPGNLTGSTILRNANVADLPESYADLTGEAESAQWGEYLLHEGDVFYHRFQGGGGYGDPIDHDPAAVARDVADGLVSPAAAVDIYGVVLADGAVDGPATWARRLDVRAERLGHPVAAHLVVGTGPAPTGRPLGEYLQITADGATQCTCCATVVAPAGTPWKDGAHLVEAPLSSAGAHRDGAVVLLRRFCCGACGTTLDADIAVAGDPIVHDEVGPWPA